jgi:asparagine synthase (glutamine-hydrolysing)
MSGICGVLSLDGGPVDVEALERMTASMRVRGPDGRKTWNHGPVGFGHTLFATTWQSERERQPATLGGEIWITADTRIDAREDLVRALPAAPARPLHDLTDPELILLAYDAWGTECVRNLIGDFAFAIWDARERLLFCARDHFGVKPFYYAVVGSCFIFSNTLDCLRRWPGVSSELNDLWIADFLLSGSNQDPQATIYREIRRLPPAQTLTLPLSGAPRLQKYWTLPIQEPVFLRRQDEYVEGFRERFRKAVQDRLRVNRVAVVMSGGLDSPGVAASARQVLGTGGEIKAFTIVYDWLIPDEERAYSSLVADWLHIPIEHVPADNHRLYEGVEDLPFLPPEPVNDPGFGKRRLDFWGRVSSHGRVAMYGEGADNLLKFELRPWVRYLRAHRRIARLAGDLAQVVWLRGGPIRAGWGLLSRLWRPSSAWNPGYPDWIASEFELKYDLRDRWRLLNQPREDEHPVRPWAYRSMQLSEWTDLLEGHDPGVLGLPVEVRNPFLDVRLAPFLLALPTIPWCYEKEVLRRAFRGLLPPAVLARRKAPLARNPVLERVRIDGMPGMPSGSGVERYVDLAKLHGVIGGGRDVWVDLRPVNLAWWLSLRGSRDSIGGR